MKYFYITVLCFLCSKYVLADSEDLNIVLDNFVKVKESKHIVETDLSIDSEGEEITVSGKVQQLVDLNDDWKVAVEVHFNKEKDGKPARIFKLPKKGVCEMMKSVYKKHFFESLKNYSNAPDPDVCPVVSNTYNLEKYPLNAVSFKKFAKEGFFNVTIQLFQNDEEMLNYGFYGHAEPAS